MPTRLYDTFVSNIFVIYYRLQNGSVKNPKTGCYISTENDEYTAQSSAENNKKISKIVSTIIYYINI